MSNPIPGNKLQRIYEQELYWLAQQICRKADATFQRFQYDGTRSYLNTDPDAFDTIYDILGDAAKVAELLNPGKTTEGKVRSQELSSILSGLTLNELLNKKLRNTLEHFGEYLDAANKEHSAIASPQRYVLGYNLVVSDWRPTNIAGVPFQFYQTSAIGFPIYPIRVYVVAERRIYNFDWSVDLAAMQSEAEAIKAAVRSLPGVAPDGWASAGFVL